MTRPKRPAHRIKHGTEATYRWHRNNGQDACPACKRAHREYNRELRRRRKAQRTVVQQMMSNGGHIPKGMTNADYDKIIATIKEDLDL